MTDFHLSTSWLRANCIRAHFFGLGFIQVKLDDRRRVHFYHQDTPAFVEEPHDHRYDFISTVLKGTLVNHIWRLVPGDSHQVSYENCRQGGPEPPPGFRSGVESVGHFPVHADSGYHINSEVFHTVHPDFFSGPVITFIERELPKKEFARAVQSGESVCPFSRPMAEEEVWAIVEKCIEY